MRILAPLACLLATLLPLAGQDTEALQARIDALPPGGVLTLEGRTYHGQGLRIAKSLVIRGTGQQRTRFVRDTAQPFFRITGKATEVTIQDLGLDGGKREAAGVEALGIRRLRLTRIQVQDCGVPNAKSLPGDRFGRPVDGVYAKDVDQAVVEQSTFLRNGRDGFIGIPVRNLVFTGNRSEGNGRMGSTSDVDPEHKAGGPLSVEYRDNVVRDCGAGGLHVESDKGLPVAKALFEGNRVTDCGNRDWGYSWGLVIGNRAEGIIRNNVIEGTGAKASLESYRNGIHLDLLGGPVLVQGNIIRDSGRAGIAVSRSPFPVRILGNEIHGSGANGISAYQAEGLEMIGNTISISARSGVWLGLCSSARLQDNTFSESSQGKPGAWPTIHVENTLGLQVTGNDLGGAPSSMGLEVLPDTGKAQLVFEGNRFEGQRSHEKMSNVRTAN